MSVLDHKQFKKKQKYARKYLECCGFGIAQADDIFQDVLLRWGKNQPIRLRDFGFGYFKQSIKYMSIDHRRKLVREFSASEDLDEDITPDGLGSVEDEYYRRELMWMWEDILKQTRPKDREVIMLSVVDECNATEIMERLKCSRNRVNGALKRYEKILKESGYENHFKGGSNGDK